MKQETAASPGSAELHRGPRPLLRTALIIAAYLCGFIILDLLSQQFEELRGVVAWYPPAGLTYTLLLVFGWRFTPAVTIALLIDSLLIYRMPQPPYLLFLWAVLISSIYGAAAWFLRHRIRFDWQLRKSRDVTALVVTGVLVSALLAILSVASSALSSDMPRGEVFHGILDWWIGETVGVLTVTPFLLIHVMPWLKRLAKGHPVGLPARTPYPRPTLSVIGQAFSIALVFYWVFGGPVANEFRPIYLIILPLIWIALDHGIKGVATGIAVSNFGVMLAMGLLRFDNTRLGELQLLMIITCVIGLLTGAVVTERRQAEDGLRKSESRFEAIVKHSLEEVSLIGADGTLLWESPTTQRPLGYPPGALVGGNVFELFHRDDRAAALQVFAQVVKQPGASRESAYRLRHRDGSWRWLEGVTTNLLDEPAVHAVVINYRDITERKQAEEALAASEAELRALFASMHDAVLVIDRDGVYRRIAPTNPVLLYRPPEELLGRSLKDVFPAEKAEEYQAAIHRVLNTGQTEHIEYELMINDRPSWFSVFITPLAEDSTLWVAHDITQRKQQEEQIQLQIQRLSGLHAVDLAIAGSLDFHVTLGILLREVHSQLSVDATCILLLNPVTQTLNYAAQRGFRGRGITRLSLRMGEDYAGTIALERHPIAIPDLSVPEHSFVHASPTADEGFVSYCGVPLIAKGQVKGVLEAFKRVRFNPDRDWLELLESLASRAAIAIDNAQLFDTLQRSNADLAVAYDRTIEGWSRSLDLRDRKTEGHTLRVAEISVELARAAGVAEDELVNIRRGALLHDIGRMGVPDDIPLKPDQLTDDEWKVMHLHPGLARDMLAQIAYLKPALDIPYCHHEKWDGTGYPRGLKGEQIPLAARLFAVIDVWDALTSDRPYRAAWPEAKVLAHIKAGSGTHFDPKAVELFLKMMSEEALEQGRAGG